MKEKQQKLMLKTLTFNK